MSCVRCCRVSISANTAFTIFRVDVFWGYRKSYVDQAVCGEWDVKDLIGRIKKWAAIQSAMTTWLRKGDDEKCF
jgi:hypothetical protein